MPIHAYICKNCGTEIERITNLLGTQMPQQIKHHCSECNVTTTFARAISAPTVITPHTTRTARKADYRRKNPDWKRNVLSGKTADGRPVQKNALQQRSAAAWNNAFQKANPGLEGARQEVDQKRKG